jgi:hypothetical protein
MSEKSIKSLKTLPNSKEETVDAPAVEQTVLLK